MPTTRSQSSAQRVGGLRGPLRVAGGYPYPRTPVHARGAAGYFCAAGPAVGRVAREGGRAEDVLDVAYALVSLPRSTAWQ
jgi:hypothetical protein